MGAAIGTALVAVLVIALVVLVLTLVISAGVGAMLHIGDGWGVEEEVEVWYTDAHRYWSIATS